MHEIVTCGEAETPFLGDVDVACHIKRVHHVVRVGLQFFSPIDRTVVVEIVVDAVSE